MNNDPRQIAAAPEEATLSGITRRQVLSAALIGTTLLFAGCSSQSSHNQPSYTYAPASPEHSVLPGQSPEQLTADLLLPQAGESLLAMHEQAAEGWRFKSAIQAPHYQTDRDVGAASVGMGFLVLADKDPKNDKWLTGAEQTAKWLSSVAQTDGHGGKYWADYVDDSERSSDVYTSFDDGTIGIGDFYWQLYEKSHDPQYKDMALSTLRWTFAQAQNIGQGEAVYSWPWKASDPNAEHYMGMGEGAVGLVHTFATYYERLKDSDPAMVAECRQYIDGTLRYINQVRTNLGNNDGDSRALPETGIIGQDGDTNMNSGYLSGAAGAAYMYLKLYQVFHDQTYLTEAQKLFSWLEDTQNGPMVTFPDSTVAWKLALDPQGGDDTHLATGFEEGSAGIGWTYLQAYKITGDKHYLDIAEKAANWLADVAVKSGPGLAWNEDEGWGDAQRNPIIHANLNNGAAGIGMFLKDLADVSGNRKYQTMAEQALAWIVASAQRDGNGVYWNDNDGENNYSNDPSWHWGKAGIISFAARMSGGKLDIPGEQASLSTN